MQKIVFIVAISSIAFVPVQLLAQKENNAGITLEVKNVSAQDEDYNQSPIGIARTQFMRRIQYIQYMNSRTNRAVSGVAFSPNGFRNKGLFNASLLQTRYGFSTIYNRRITRDLYFIGEIGYYYTNSDRGNPALANRLIGLPARDVYEATIFPLYGGISRGFLLDSKLKRFYPYVGAGAGPVLGMGYERNQFDSNRTFQVAPSAYVKVGTEFYPRGKWFFDIGVRYRYLTFSRYLANWKDFSGFMFNFGFGYGIGKQLLR